MTLLAFCRLEYLSYFKKDNERPSYPVIPRNVILGKFYYSRYLSCSSSSLHFICQVSCLHDLNLVWSGVFSRRINGDLERLYNLDFFSIPKCCNVIWHKWYLSKEKILKLLYISLKFVQLLVIICRLWCVNDWHLQACACVLWNRFWGKIEAQSILSPQQKSVINALIVFTSYIFSIATYE